MHGNVAAVEPIIENKGGQDFDEDVIINECMEGQVPESDTTRNGSITAPPCTESAHIDTDIAAMNTIMFTEVRKQNEKTSVNKQSVLERLKQAVLSKILIGGKRNLTPKPTTTNKELKGFPVIAYWEFLSIMIQG